MSASAWAVPACSACGGVAVDDQDGSECAHCSGTGVDHYRAESATDRAEVAKQFVQNWGALLAMEAAGFYLGISDPTRRHDLDVARAEWATVYADAFGSSADRRIGVGAAGVTTLAAAMRDAVAAAAVLFAVEARDEESEIDDLDIAAIRGARPLPVAVAMEPEEAAA